MRPARRLLVVAAALLLTAALGGLGWRELQRDADAAVPAVPASPGLAGAWLTPTVASAPVSGVAASSTTPASVAKAAAEDEDEVMEICGLGRISKRQAQAWSPAEMLKAKAHMDALERRKDAALSQLSARLAAGSDRERVAARLLMGDIEGAALIAARSSDGMAYRLALQSCSGREMSATEPSCRGLTTLTWARLDAEDALPWLWLLGEALQRRDDAAAGEALEQVMQRRRSTGRPLLSIVGNVPVGDADAVGLGLAMVGITGQDFALPDHSYVSISRYCSVKAVKDEARRLHCERFARWQFTHAHDLMDAGTALSIADRVGLPADQRPYTRAQLRQAQDRMVEASTQLTGADCSSLARAAVLPAHLLERSEVQRFLQPLLNR